MNNLEFTAIIGISSILAGLLGALTGLGGGVVVVPLLTLGLDVDLRYAIGCALVSVIATSSGAAVSYVREGYSNIRVGMFLEVATTFGAVTGALIAAKAPTRVIAILFGIVLLISTYLSDRPHNTQAVDHTADPLAIHLKLDGSYPTSGGEQPYHVQHVPSGFAVMLIAGAFSGLLGIGSGALKVVAMDQVMQLPFKVSTTTSNFMIGVTAAASAGIYLGRGYIDPGLCMPVLLGVLVGAWCGAKVLVRAKVTALRLVFSFVLFVIGIEMIYNGITGKI
ncbi:MAG: sulfite exporter TauE/SafE family protein [Myxacorys chilensis ATA2-1-KO14]|jgi:hypothetical protein|nr:sulfite exporter TauE/SafE family protein [Myxacorys chilensis ATA2-1-KO14]